MNNHRKIGFRAYNDNAQNSEEDEQKKKQAERQKAIADFIDVYKRQHLFPSQSSRTNTACCL